MHELVEGEQWQAGAFRSDAIMVLHINQDRQQAQLISIPRDSWVTVPGHGKNKINAALSLGGPELAARTVEDTFDLYLDHVMLIDFQGFRDLSDILDGVKVNVSETTTDTLSGKVWAAGPHDLKGNDALLFVRQRYGLAGGDFDRMHRQQAFLKAVLDGVVSRGTVFNPVRITRLADEASELVAVDEHFTTKKMRALAISSRGLRSHAMRFLTVPNLGSGTVGKASVVKLDMAKATEMFAAVEADRFEGWYAHNEVDEMAANGVVD
nr:LCP family protein [Nocardioides daedukensis]